jgi:hypothetical protein
MKNGRKPFFQDPLLGLRGQPQGVNGGAKIDDLCRVEPLPSGDLVNIFSMDFVQGKSPKKTLSGCWGMMHRAPTGLWGLGWFPERFLQNFRDMGKLSFRASEARPGIQDIKRILDSGFRRNDGVSDFCRRLFKICVYPRPICLSVVRNPRRRKAAAEGPSLEAGRVPEHKGLSFFRLHPEIIVSQRFRVQSPFIPPVQDFQNFESLPQMNKSPRAFFTFVPGIGFNFDVFKNPFHKAAFSDLSKNSNQRSAFSERICVFVLAES